MSKYGAVKTMVDGHCFASKGEAGRYRELEILMSAHQINDLRLQVVYDLAPAVMILGRRPPPLRYVADFVYMRYGREVVEDFKGVRTEGYRIKRHLMKAIHGIDIYETGAK